MYTDKKPLYPAGPYTCSRDKDGCDDVWNIYAPESERSITSIPFWDDEPEWAERAKATAHLFAAAPAMVEALRIADGVLNLLIGKAYATSQLGKEIRDAMWHATGSRETLPAKDTESQRLLQAQDVGMALLNVIGHFAPAEKIDFEQQQDEQARENHIFKDLKLLDQWLRHFKGLWVLD